MGTHHPCTVYSYVQNENTQLKLETLYSQQTGSVSTVGQMASIDYNSNYCNVACIIYSSTPSYHFISDVLI